MGILIFIIIIFVIGQILRSIPDNHDKRKPSSISNNSSKVSYKYPNLPKEIQLTSNIKENSLIIEAINKNKKLAIEYEAASGEITNRVITPVKIFSGPGRYGKYHKYIEAYCHLRDAKRNFKINRILKIEIYERY